MGEEEKKAEEAKKIEEEKVEKKDEPTNTKDENPTDGKKEEEGKEAAPPPPPPQEIVLRVYMHCEGCARKVRRCLKGFDGVEDVMTDCRTSMVVVKGEKADPLKVLERVQRKSHRQVELLSPIPPPPPQPPAAEEEPKKPEEKEAKTEEKTEEPPVVSVVLRAYMHCDACAQEIRKRIQRMKGVESVEPDLKSSEVMVKGAFEPEKLVDYVYKRTGKQAMILKVEPEIKEDEKGKTDKEEKKPAEEGEKATDKANEGGKEDEEGSPAAVVADGGGEEPPAKEEPQEEPKMELKRNEFYQYYPQNYQIYPQRVIQDMHSYPPQIFSDENPNACTVM